MKGASATGTTHAHLNFGSQGAANTDTRAIDIWGSWGDQEAKLITWNHGSAASNMVCQQRVRYNASPSSTYYEIGRFYHGQNTTAFPVRFVSTSTTTANLELDGNLKVSSGNGIDFSAAGNASGMSSELLDDYEEGSWTISDAEGSNPVTSNVAWYVKVGSLVHIRGSVNIGTTSTTSRISLTLPFNSNNNAYYAGEGCIGYTSYTGATPRAIVENSGTRLYFYNENSTNLMTWQNFSGSR